jgi:hypothetical protein
MERISRSNLLMLLGPLVVAIHSASCSDDAVSTQSSQDGGDPETEERRLCQASADWEQKCLLENGFALEETLEERFDRCMSGFFREEMEPCRDVSVAYVSCIPTQSCEVFPYTDETPRGCTEESHPYSVCAAGPEEWEALGCDASKCPGECCQGP